mmetsp:Transcript_34958/g.84560  ORF Transcript_34958/g.84560 Transcript_34958/m.84560 type:complete len:120 (+) Transcript_34958:1894-2253(+)
MEINLGEEVDNSVPKASLRRKRKMQTQSVTQPVEIAKTLAVDVDAKVVNKVTKSVEGSNNSSKARGQDKSEKEISSNSHNSKIEGRNNGEEEEAVAVDVAAEVVAEGIEVPIFSRRCLC